MHELIDTSTYFFTALTLVAYSIGSFCQKKWNKAILNPILIGAVLVMIVLSLLDIPNAAYQSGCQVLNYLFTPATICLAISFYEQFQKMKRHLPAVCLGVVAGTVCSLGSIWFMSRLFGLEHTLSLSLLPKSITTAIGVVLSQEIGGIAAVTTAAIAITGIFGNITGPALCKLLRIRNPIAQGVAFGTATHVIGTARAVQLSPLIGAVSSLSLTIAGIVTTVLLSFLAQFL